MASEKYIFLKIAELATKKAMLERNTHEQPQLK